MANIWIVEDDPKIGLLIEMTMTKSGHETLRLTDDAALDQALQRQERLPDLMLLDLMLRAKSGFEILREWKASRRTRQIPILIISARSTEQDKVRGLELGAEDYITKPFGVRELQARVHAALRRLEPAPERLTIGALTLLPRSKDTLVEGRRVELTAMEYELLLYLVRHPDTAISRGTLIREVWGYATEEDPSRTVDAHVKTLRLKLGDSADSPRFIQTVRGTGYRLITGDAP